MSNEQAFLLLFFQTLLNFLGFYFFMTKWSRIVNDLNIHYEKTTSLFLDHLSDMYEYSSVYWNRSRHLDDEDQDDEEYDEEEECDEDDQDEEDVEEEEEEEEEEDEDEDCGWEDEQTSSSSSSSSCCNESSSCDVSNSTCPM